MRKNAVLKTMLVLVLMVALLASCAPGGGDTNTPSGTTGEPTQGSQANNEPEEKPTLKWLIAAGFYDLDLQYILHHIHLQY